MTLRRLAVFIVAFAATWASAEYPDKPIRFVVPFAAGGGADALARAVADGMSKVLGQPVIVDDRPGGDATIGGIYVARSAPDGYTILFASNTGFSGAPFLHRNVGYDPVKDFTPISMLGMFPYFIVVNNEVPAKTLHELVEYARANPGKVNYASGNAMGIIATAQLAAAEKLQMVHVPYKGEAPAMPDLLGNRVQMIFNTGFIVPHVKEGRVRALAAMMDERNEALPDVPTVAEAGFPNLAVRGWASVVGPAGLPRDIQVKLSNAVNESLRMESTKKQLAVQGFPGKGSTPEALGEFIVAQLQSWGAAVKAAGIEPD
ncbi:MAG TPA: tripartite tricarboxylate transporter substrate-binding protein [Usitatibacter sp.]|nr:tripartite tricarboxylate transporter substrate-binding protein [Usitatibacter sp.]